MDLIIRIILFGIGYSILWFTVLYGRNKNLNLYFPSKHFWLIAILMVIGANIIHYGIMIK